MQRYYLQTLGQTGGSSLPRKIYRKVATWLTLVSASSAGNELGLVYYCLAYTALAVLFYKTPIVVAAGMLPLAYGDGLGAVIGQKFGKHPYKITDRKSLEGSAAVLVGAAVAAFAGFAFYGMPWPEAAGKACAIGLVATAAEALAPHGLDNLAIPLCATATFLLLGAVP